MQTSTAESPALSPVSGDLYANIARFLFDEAELLSAGRYAEWGALLAPDINYVVPAPSFMQRGQERDYGIGNPYFDDDIHSLKVRIGLYTEPGKTTAENPPAKLRHFVTNVRADQTGDPGEYRVRSNVLVYRIRYTEAQPFLLSGARTDLLRRSGDGFKLAQRVVDIEQASIQAPNLSFFL